MSLVTAEEGELNKVGKKKMVLEASTIQQAGNKLKIAIGVWVTMILQL